MKRLKIVIHSAAIALAFSTFCWFGMIGPLVSPNHIWVYHHPGPTTSIFLATIVNVILLALILTGLFLLARRSKRLHVFLWSGIILMTPWLVFKEGALVGAWDLSRRTSVIVFGLSCLCWIGVMLLWSESSSRFFSRVQRCAEVALTFGSLSATILLVQLFWCCWQSRELNRLRPLHQSRSDVFHTNSPPKSRVIWLLLDELSYEQTYGRRFPGLNLPNFDLLARQSTVFTHVIPAGLRTQEVLPTLLTGVTVDHIQVAANGNLVSLHDSISNKWRPFDAHQTIFQDAIDSGHRNAVAGWYNPYCRVLGEELDQCFWTFRVPAAGMLANATVLSNVAAPWIGACRRASSFFKSGAKAGIVDDDHLDDYRDLYAAGDRYLSDSTLDFVFLHMPIPHPPGMYNRHTGEFDSRGSYLDNLALADQYLEHVHTLLKDRGEWDSAAIVIMGDHAWRTKMWVDSPYWTHEDQEASHGLQFDDRPGYIVKLPYQSKPLQVDAPFAATRTRALVQEILNGGMRSSADIEAFAKRTGGPPTK